MRDNKATTIDSAEKARFEKHAKVWWNTEGPFWPLHRMNALRTELIVEQVLTGFTERPTDHHQPLSGLKVLDIGCGGGLLCEPMARLGAEVTGIDPSEKNIKTASVHAGEQELAIDYRATTAEALAAAGERFDVARDPRHERSTLFFVVISEAQAMDVIEQPYAHREESALSPCSQSSGRHAQGHRGQKD